MGDKFDVSDVEDAVIVKTDVLIDEKVFEENFRARVQREGWVKPSAAALPLDVVTRARGVSMAAVAWAFACTCGIDISIAHHAPNFLADALRVYYQTPYLWNVMQHIITLVIYFAIEAWVPLPKQRCVGFVGVTAIWSVTCIAVHFAVRLFPPNAVAEAAAMPLDPAIPYWVVHMSRWFWILGVGYILEWHAESKAP